MYVHVNVYPAYVCACVCMLACADLGIECVSMRIYALERMRLYARACALLKNPKTKKNNSQKSINHWPIFCQSK